MDPITHTLVGAALAETGLKRASRFATATLIVGANLPDVDAITYFISGDRALLVRRGWTHGVLAMATLPALLGFTAWFVASRVGVRSKRSTVSLTALVGLAYLAVWTHPLLDWMNSYGVRLLMPFYNRWFYGDALFIVDPWLWLILASAVVVAHTRRWYGAVGWAIAAAAGTMLIVRAGPASTPVLAAWCAGLGSIVALRVGGADERRVARSASVALGIAAVYLVTMIAGTRLANRQARAWLSTRQVRPEQVAALPVPGNPFTRDVIVVTPERYYFVEVNWLRRDRIRFSDRPIDINNSDRIARAAMDALQVRGLKGWIRFPAYEVHPIRNGYRVVIKDVRFSRMRQGGVGYQEVDLDRNLVPR